MKRAAWIACSLVALGALWLALRPSTRHSETQRKSAEEPAESGAAGELVEASRPEREDGRVAPEPSAPSEEAESAAEAPAAVDAGLRIVSRIGLPLEHVFVAGTDGLERKVALGPDGTCDAPLELSCELRAAGHRRVRVEAAGTVELEPVFGLVLRAQGLAERIAGASGTWKEIELDGGRYFEVEGVIACGFAGEDALALAIDWDPPRMVQERTTLSFWTADNRFFDAAPKPGTLGTFEEQIDLGDAELTLLALTATCPQGCIAPPKMELWPDLPAASPQPRVLARNWGNLTLHEARHSTRRLDAGGAGRRVAAGQGYGATALCTLCGSYGRRMFVAPASDGTLDVELDQRPVLLRATVERGSWDRGSWDRGSWDNIRLDWTFERDRDREPEMLPELAGWLDGANVPVAADGTLELRLPTKLPKTGFSSWPLPALLRLRVRAGASEERVLYVDLPASGVVDLGPLFLSSPAPHLVLAAGHGVVDAQLVIARSGGELVRFGINHPSDCRARADGALELRFHPQLASGDPAIFASDSRPTELLVADGQLAARAFSWDGSAYGALPVVSRSLRIDCAALPEGAVMAHFGVTWRGLPLELGWGAQTGTSKDWSLTWPADAGALWWSLESPPVFADGRGATVGLTPELAVLRIPSGQ